MNAGRFSSRLATERTERAIPPDEGPWTESEAHVEASRCLYCFNAPCARACPAGVDVAEFVRSIRTGAFASAARLVLSANVLADVLPDLAAFSDVVHLIEVSASARGSYAQIAADPDTRKAICYIG